MTPACRLYLLTPDTLEPDFAARLAAALDAGDVAAVRLRLPGADAATLRAAAESLRPVVQSRGVAFIIAGDAALAAATASDGVHLTPSDMPPAQARRLIGDLQLGVFCGASRDQAMDAGDGGADYIAFGAFGGDPDSSADPALITWWSELMELPVVAEGDIDAGNCAALVQAGADFLAVGDAVWNNAAGPAEAVRALNAAIAAATPVAT
jgi:thiamine-phosphate pyrophosphorylase